MKRSTLLTVTVIAALAAFLLYSTLASQKFECTVAVTFKGEVLETDTLRYLNATDKIVSDSFVKLTRGKDVLTGIGFECDHTLESVDIKKDVRARILEEDGKFDDITP